MALGIDDVRVGVWTHPDGHTGCTVVLPPEGSLGALAVRGGSPGTREAAALGPTGTVAECHAVVLSGGSAFGLSTADGVMGWCEEQGIGYDKVVARVPIVGAAIVFDLAADAPRPGAAAGRQACAAASHGDPAMGRVGVGAGCTVGKTAGLQWCSPGGQGWAVRSAGGVTVGALMGVNALGDVIGADGQVLVGSRAPGDAPRWPAGPPPGGPTDAPQPEPPPPEPSPAEHTVIGCIVTDAKLDKPAAHRAADLAHSGIARAIDPAHTSFDGDGLFMLSTQRVEAGVDLVADLAARAVADAIRAAVTAAADAPPEGTR